MDDMAVARDLRDRVMLTPAEKEAIGYTVVGNAIKWNEEAAEDHAIDIDLSGIERTKLKAWVADLDTRKEVSVQMLDICERMRELKKGDGGE
jgi:hypothetical protein